MDDANQQTEIRPSDSLVGGSAPNNSICHHTCSIIPAWPPYYSDSPFYVALFYLVCGGEMTLDKERRSREQMNMIYKTIIEKGLTTEDHIEFVSGRGGQLNSTNNHHSIASGANFGLYSSTAASQAMQNANGKKH